MVLNKIKRAGKVPSNVEITPFDPRNDDQEFGIDIRAGDTARVRNDKGGWDVVKLRGLTLKPGEVYLIDSAQHLHLRTQLAMCTLNERMRRQGILYSPGFFHRGYKGKMVFAFSVSRNTMIKPGDPIINLHFVEGGGTASDYKGKYQGGA